MTAPSDLIRRDTVEAMLRDRIAECDRTLARSRCAEDIEDATAERRELEDLVTILRALPADPVAEAAGELAEAHVELEDAQSEFIAAGSPARRRGRMLSAIARMRDAGAAYRAAVAARDAGEGKR